MPLKIEIFADPGLPFRLAQAVTNRWPPSDDETPWCLSEEEVPVHPDGTMDVGQVQSWTRERGSDVTVIITEIPQREEHRPRIASIYPDDALVVISVPALGWLRLEEQLTRTVHDALVLLQGKDTVVASGVVHEESADRCSTFYVASPWWRPGRIRLVLGMVRINEPFSTAPKLSSALAAANATGAFGIFYSSIWSMADALPAWRLMVITVMTIAAMVAWLVATNGLWETSHEVGGNTEAVIYNGSTVVTLLVTMCLLYSVLFVTILFGGWVVIDEGFLATTIGEKVDFTNYLDIAWLSASMGTIAGALGSNFDKDVDIRRLTHGRRRSMKEV